MLRFQVGELRTQECTAPSAGDASGQKVCVVIPGPARVVGRKLDPWTYEDGSSEWLGQYGADRDVGVRVEEMGQQTQDQISACRVACKNYLQRMSARSGVVVETKNLHRLASCLP